jgi:hypothetical protein
MRVLVAYYRVSTGRQRVSGLGLEAQREAVARHVGAGQIVAEYTEAESGKRHTNGNYPLNASGRSSHLPGAPEDSESIPLRPDGCPYSKGPVWKWWLQKGQNPVLGWWQHSYARKLAQEICKFPGRILATLQRPSHFRHCVPPAPRNLAARNYSSSCILDIESLRAEYPWAGDLDLQMAARAYQLGCQFAVCICTQSS